MKRRGVGGGILTEGSPEQFFGRMACRTLYLEVSDVAHRHTGDRRQCSEAAAAAQQDKHPFYYQSYQACAASSRPERTHPVSTVLFFLLV